MAKAVNRDNILEFLRQVKNDNNNAKWKDKKLMFKLFLDPHSTKHSEIILRTKSVTGGVKFMHYSLKEHPFITQTTFKEFAEKMDDLGLLIATGKDFAKLNIKLVQTFPEGIDLLEELQ